MSWAKMSHSARSLTYAVTIITLAAVSLWFGAFHNTTEANTTAASVNAAPTATFAADPASLGAIPDDASGCGIANGTGAPRNVTFTVSGLSGSVTSVEVNNLTFNPVHTWRGDIIATLIAPNGASHVLFGRTGATTTTSCGNSSDLAGPYAFSDAASATNWWTVSGSTTPAGSYRTTALGETGPTTGTVTSMNPAFTGVTNANGTWTLRLVDSGSGDTGSVTAATLTVNTGTGVTSDANVDMNGDGKTDWVVVRATTTPSVEGGAPSEVLVNRGAGSVRERMKLDRESGATENALAPPMYWYININGGGPAGVPQLGDAATDFLTPEDFDGDGKDDVAVWRPGAPNQAAFYILQSSNNTVRVEAFGQTGDDPAIVGDYDGDNKADPAVFRCPATPGQCFFFFRGSNNNPSGNTTYVPWGFGETDDFFVNPGDFDGDGKYDFCLQRTAPGSTTQGQFVLLRSSDFGVEYINWGNDNDFILPGDYDGDGKSDFMVLRTVSGQRHHWLLTRTGTTSFVTFGVAGDYSAPGDYDGDGKQDIAIWRQSADPTQNLFWVLRSSDGSVQLFEWGQQDDVPAASWYIH